MPLPRPTRPISHDVELIENVVGAAEPREAAVGRAEPDTTAFPVAQTVARAAPSQYTPSDVFFFEPAADITTAELADLVKLFFNGVLVHHDLFTKLPVHLKRHFEHRKVR